MEPSDDFSDLLKKAPGVVLVDFYADWCGPCKVQGEILNDMQTMAAQHQATIIKVNIDQHRELADQFQVSGIPTLMLISDGKIIDRTSGIADRQTVSTMLAY
jgi:thioredoxin